MSAASLPQLRFRLPGEWIALDPRDEDGAREHIATIARAIVGPADELQFPGGRGADQIPGAVGLPRRRPVRTRLG